jgi:molecular chaperone DnaK
MRTINFGIDLGTTNSLIAKYENAISTVLKNPVGFKETLPSAVAYRKERVLVGDKAREYLTRDAVNVFSNFKSASTR